MNRRCPNLKPVLFFLASALLAACTVSVQTQAEEGGAGSLETQVARLETQVVRQEELLLYLATRGMAQEEIIAYLATQMPSGEMPPYGDTTQSPTPYLPVSGAVRVEEGACCAGGTVGEVIVLRVQFEGRSQVGEVVEMRVLAGGTPDGQGLAEKPWEPYRPEAAYPVEIQIANWIGWWVAVQYRDSAGNVSPVYLDDISIEGMSPAPTPTK